MTIRIEDDYTRFARTPADLGKALRLPSYEVETLLARPGAPQPGPLGWDVALVAGWLRALPEEDGPRVALLSKWVRAGSGGIRVWGEEAIAQAKTPEERAAAYRRVYGCATVPFSGPFGKRDLGALPGPFGIKEPAPTAAQPVVVPPVASLAEQRKDNEFWQFRLAAIADAYEKHLDRSLAFEILSHTGVPVERDQVTLGIDLDGVRVPQRMPLLLGHEEDAVLGVVFESRREAEGVVHKGYFARGPLGRAVVDLARYGVPWQASIGVAYDPLELVPAGSSVVLNGHEVAGPVAVARCSRIVEVSLLAARDAADINTGARFYEGVTPFNPGKRVMLSSASRLAPEIVETLAQLEVERARGVRDSVETLGRLLEVARRAESRARYEATR